MNTNTARKVAERIREHVEKHDLPEVAIVFHGGEPLLVGEERLRFYLETLRSEIPCNVAFGIQTNATLLSTEIANILLEFNVKIGISIDGGEKENDLHRRFRNGGSSYSKVIKAVELLKSRPELFELLGGFLVVVDLRNDPAEVYRALVKIGARSVDLLLPDAHHDAPPLRPTSLDSATAYGRWLIDFFEVWQSNEARLEVRYLEEIIGLLLGVRSTLESIGAQSVDIVVVETDGAIEPVDSLKVVGRQATGLGLNVENNSFDEALEFPALYSRMMGYEALSETCRSCPDLESCGGGYLPHRYGRGNGFLNPSVYCDDLRYLFAQLRDRLLPTLTRARKEEAQPDPSGY
jgi:uncharacterized protein